MNNELKHYGRMGMKWGQHIFGKVNEHQKKIRRRRLDKETQMLVNDSKTVTAKAEPGKTKMVYGKYRTKVGNGIQLASHIVDEYGDVKLSYIRGVEGDHYVAAGKNIVSKMNLNQYFYSLKGTWDYDIYK